MPWLPHVNAWKAAIRWDRNGRNRSMWGMKSTFLIRILSILLFATACGMFTACGTVGATAGGTVSYPPRDYPASYPPQGHPPASYPPNYPSPQNYPPGSGEVVVVHDAFPNELRIPAGHLPPPGSCRIWYPDRPPGQQPPPGDCSDLAQRVPPGAWLLSRPEHERENVHVTAYDRQQPGIQIGIRIFNAATGRMVRDVHPAGYGGREKARDDRSDKDDRKREGDKDRDRGTRTERD